MLGRVRIILQLLAQAGNAYQEDFLIAAILRSPDAGEELFRRHDLADVVSKLQKQTILGRGE